MANENKEKEIEQVLVDCVNQHGFTKVTFKYGITHITTTHSMRIVAPTCPGKTREIPFNDITTLTINGHEHR